MSDAATMDRVSEGVVAALGFENEMTTLRRRIAAWVESCDPEMREALEWQFLSGSKYFRPLTIFACYRSLMPGDRVLSQCFAGDRRHC
jgi:geranylgeranyl pyrophosphate synthase